MKKLVMILMVGGIALGASAQTTETGTAAGQTAAMGASAQTTETGTGTEAGDSLVMMPGYEMLDEIVIEGETPVIQANGAKLTYNVDEDPAAGSSSAMDILKKVPQVTVDGDGNILLNGSGAFKLQLNGMENPMIKQYAKQILEAAPASMISKIEVITEPGAKEDAEGSAGIINIITERAPAKGEVGYSGSASLRVDNRSLTPSLSGVLKKDNFTLSANVNYQWSYAPQKTGQDIATEYTGGDNPGTLYTTVRQKVKHQYVGGNLSMSWEPNADNLFTAGANAFYVDGRLPVMDGTTTWVGRGATTPGWSYSQDGTGGMKLFNLSANASYKHTFGHEGNYLVLSYLFNFGRNDLNLDRRTYDMVNYNEPLPYQKQQSLTYDRGHTVQADYANDFHSEKHLLEVGFKGIFRHNTAASSYLYGTTPDKLVGFPQLDNDIMQPQNIYAGYASYTGTFGKLGVVAGLRYEHTMMGITNRTPYDAPELGNPTDAPLRSFRNRLNDWVPNASLTWNFSAATNLRLGYQMRISRPSINQVNPFELSFTPYQINTGNPDLTSERINMVSLKFSSFGTVFGGQIGVEYNVTNNAITSVTYLRESDGINAVVTSFANIGRREEAALAGFFNWNIIKGMTLAATGRLAYNRLNAPTEGFRNHGWSGNIGANWNYTVADVNRFSAYGMWSARSISLQGYSTDFYYYGISAARDFLADRSLSLSISANNFLQRKMKYAGHTVTPDVIYDNTAYNLAAWNVGISITWKFGKLNAKVKQTGVEVTNDDLNKSSNSSQTGSSVGL